MTLKPSVKQMLEVGKGCGLSHIEEVYDDYMRHFDLFFLISDYSNQYGIFLKELEDSKLIYKTEGGRYSFFDLSIEEALNLL